MTFCWVYYVWIMGKIMQIGESDCFEKPNYCLEKDKDKGKSQTQNKTVRDRYSS